MGGICTYYVWPSNTASYEGNWQKNVMRCFFFIFSSGGGGQERIHITKEQNNVIFQGQFGKSILQIQN
jgi:hypothetical protein